MSRLYTILFIGLLFSAQNSDGEIDLEGSFNKLSATASDGSIYLPLPGTGGNKYFLRTGGEIKVRGVSAVNQANYLRKDHNSPVFSI